MFEINKEDGMYVAKMGGQVVLSAHTMSDLEDKIAQYKSNSEQNMVDYYNSTNSSSGGNQLFHNFFKDQQTPPP